MESNESIPEVKETSQSETHDQVKDNTEVGTANKKNLPNAFKPTMPDAKWIQVYVNGDEHFSGLKCVVNSKHYRSFDVFLNYLTERLQPSFGAIRNIYTPVNGNSIHQLEELLPNCKYVVAGQERLKKLEPGYADIGGKSVKRSEFKPYLKRKANFVIAKPTCHSTVTLCFYKNGSSSVTPCKIIFQNKDLGDWNRIFQKIDEKMQCGFIKRLYSTNGKPIKSVTELDDGQSYVVVGKYEIFKRVAYKTSHIRNKSYGQQSGKLSCPEFTNSSAQSRRIISRAASIASVRQNEERKNTGPLFRNPSDNEKDKNNNNDPAGKEDFNKSSFKNYDNSTLKIENPSESEALLQMKQIDLDVDWSGIYRAKMQSYLTAGATEIQEDVETAVEVPLDQWDSEEIEEELTPDMERSMQQLNLVDAPDELVAFLPSMQGKQPMANDGRVSTDKHNRSQSETIDSQNLLM